MAAVIPVTYLLILNLIPLITPFRQSSTGHGTYCVAP